jgi:TrmH family RNA methyltransferase
MTISSRNNPLFKQTKRVREGREPDLIFVEGVRLAEECLRADLEISTAIHLESEKDPRTQALLSDLRETGAKMVQTTPTLIDSLSDTTRHQGIILIAKRPKPPPIQNATLTVGLDRVQDPGNLGTLLRTAEASGADGVILLKGSTDAFSPKVLRASMGASFRLSVTENFSPDELVQHATDNGLQLVAATGSGASDYDQYDWKEPTLLLLGNEANGVDSELLSLCQHRLRIPTPPQVESLNVAAAGAVMLFEAARQRRVGQS